MGIVEVSLLIIVENIVGLLNRFESDLCFLSFAFWDLIGMTGESGLFIVDEHRISILHADNVIELKDKGHFFAYIYLPIRLSDFILACASMDL